MKLHHIYNITETLDLPLPYTKLSDRRYVIDCGTEQIMVILYPARIDKYNCLAVTFVNPKSSNPMAVTNFFNGPGAVRVFSTIVKIIDPIPFNLVMFTPDDISVDIENKKLNLYQVVLKRLERLGKISSYEKVTIDEFDKPILVGMRNVIIDNQELINVIKQFGLKKMM